MTRLLSLATFAVVAASAPAQVGRVAPAAALDTPAGFRFVTVKGKYVDLLYGDRKILRYENAPHDPNDHYLTFKPYHHVFDPFNGETLLTSGAVPLVKENLYPHHRGLFYGWNKISYDGKTADVWHGTNNVYSQHDKMLVQEAGPDKAVQTAAISWHGKDGKTFAEEERTYTVYNVPGGTEIDFASTLTTKLDKVHLDGDPQHAGFHFRAAMEVSKHGKNDTYYLRPDGKGKMGDTRNWDPKKVDERTINLPWDAMSFVVVGKRYTVLRIDSPSNPKPSRGSERDYGRFGDYFVWDLTPTTPLKVKYRIWVQAGEMTVDQCSVMAKAFVNGSKKGSK
ncbi:MAG TPA: DUF6807 family protein [Fimbriiglobus sp.]|jgi:hypothetical protein